MDKLSKPGDPLTAIENFQHLISRLPHDQHTQSVPVRFSLLVDPTGILLGYVEYVTTLK